MDRATVIVAIPPVGDKIHKISSEAIPHLTLLYLGDVQLSEGAVLYVQHACEELSPFGLSVDYRGTLGEDDADVLFFEDNRWDLKRVSEFRHYLLLNDEIKMAYEAAEQHPQWTPHLTLGYPAAPAREIEGEDNYLGYIQFDRVAVWTGDFEGPEFRLKYDDYGMGEVAMSDMSMSELGERAANQLFHYGVKGMRWGVTHNPDGTTSVNQTKVKKSLRKTDQPVTVTQKKAGTYVKAKGGQRQTASSDAVKAQAARQKAKRSTTDSLSTKELKDTIERMRLEQEYAKLDKKVSRKGSSFVSRLMQSPEAKQAALDLLAKANS